MLKLAVEAQLPLIAVSTRDVLNSHDVITHLIGQAPLPYDPAKTELAAGKVYRFRMSEKTKLPLFSLYGALAEMGSTLILINAPEVREPMFDAGELPVPRKLVHRFLREVVDDDNKATELMTSLGGCTLKEIAELARLTMARDNALTPKGLALTRKTRFQGSNGLSQISGTEGFYQPLTALQNWLEKEKEFFLKGKDPRLIPRGLLLDGPPGTGKTSAAKWLANQLGVPAYRVDIGGTKNKYVGQSEQNLLTNLARLDNEEPCVALLDEVEKIFGVGGHDSSGTTSTMMSQLLWWLAERRSRVLVIMTTNNASALPKELYREGRIDRTFKLDGIEKFGAIDFVKAVAMTFPGMTMTDDQAAEVVGSTQKMPGDEAVDRWSQAALTTATYAKIKTLIPAA